MCIIMHSFCVLQELIRDRIQKQEQLSEIEKQIESVRSWYDRAVAVTFEQPVRTSSSRFVKEQLLDATVSTLSSVVCKMQVRRLLGGTVGMVPPNN